MSVEMEFKAQGFEELFARLDAIKDEVGKGKTDKLWRQMLSNAAKPILATAKLLAPKDTGQMAEHIYLKVHRPMARDKAGKSYAGEVYMARITASTIRDDTVYKFIVNKNNKLQTVLANKKPVPVSQEFGNAHTGAHPFLRPALEQNIDKVTELMASQLKIWLDSYDRSKARGR
jgi:HK97 gp10 family phage protein